jgi:uncharacterized membrane protein YpjA
LTRRLILGIVVIINLMGTAFGYYYYQGLLSSSPLWQWLFIPDSPNSTLLFSLALSLILLGRASNTFGALGCVYVMKYGLWTMFVILYYHAYFLSPVRADYYWLMFSLHLGMVLEPVLILPTLKKNKMIILIPLFLLLLNDYVDYFLGTSPLYSFPLDDLGVTPILCGAASIFLSLLVYILSGNRALERIWGGNTL